MADNKFSRKESGRNVTSLAHSPAGETAEPTTKKKMISMNVPEDMLKKFTYINKKKGTTNTAVLNMYIAEYVAANSELL